MRLPALLLSMMLSAPATLSAPAAAAADWTRYANARFGYEVDIPPGFSVTSEAANGDGLSFGGRDGAAELLVFGSNLLDRSFQDEVGDRIDAAGRDGWTISYRRISSGWASYSGARGDRILYVRAVPLCNDAAGFAQIEYDRAARKRYDAIVRRLARSLHPAAGCVKDAAPPPLARSKTVID